MAASDVDIVNMALGHLGTARTSARSRLPMARPRPTHAARVYAHIRDWLLERFPWKFALRRPPWPSARTSRSAPGTTSTPSRTTACVISVLPRATPRTIRPRTSTRRPTRDGQGLILTDAIKDATARFVARVTDPGKFTPGFTETFSWFLAASLAGPIIKGETGRAEAIRCIQAASWPSAPHRLSANQAKRGWSISPSSSPRAAATDPDDIYPT
jgi:hypothetical protein